MTTLQDKSPSELNVICAELCGWKWRDEHVSAGHFPEFVPGCWINEDDDERVELTQDLPPYATSYDAIMPVIAALSDEQKHAFSVILAENVWGPRSWRDWRDTWAITSASPADLTRALILVLQSK